MKLHEIGLLAKDPKASKKFYHDTLGLRLDHEEDGPESKSAPAPVIQIAFTFLS